MHILLTSSHVICLERFFCYLLQSIFVPPSGYLEGWWVLFLLEVHCHKLVQGEGAGRRLPKLQEPFPKRCFMNLHDTDHIGRRS